MTILSVNKTRDLDGRIAPIFCGQWPLTMRFLLRQSSEGLWVALGIVTKQKL